MKKFYFFLVLLISCVFMACSDDDHATPKVVPLQDTMNPTIRISSPESNDTFLLIERVQLVTRLEDDIGFSEVRVFLIYPDGKDSLAHEEAYIPAYLRTLDYKLDLRLPKGAPTGTYNLMVEAKDKAQNTTRDSVSINFHTPDLSMEDFTRAFETASIFYAYDWGWFGFDFYEGINLHELGFGFFLFVMVDALGGYDVSRDEWDKFVADFGIKNQKWTEWDEDKNGVVSDQEFDEAIRKSGLFRKWDTNKNAILDKGEFASGVFSRWDNNKDGKLNREEYLERFYTYLTRPSRR